MSGHDKRKGYLHTNKYQRQILAVALLPMLIMCALVSTYVTYFQNELINMLLYSTEPLTTRWINRGIFFILTILWLAFIAITLWTYSVSSRLVGGFERVSRELDEFIQGSRTRMSIRARSKDDLANEILKRINILLKKIPDSHNKTDLSKSIGRF